MPAEIKDDHELELVRVINNNSCAWKQTRTKHTRKDIGGAGEVSSQWQRDTVWNTGLYFSFGKLCHSSALATMESFAKSLWHPKTQGESWVFFFGFFFFSSLVVCKNWRGKQVLMETTFRNIQPSSFCTVTGEPGLPEGLTMRYESRRWWAQFFEPAWSCQRGQGCSSVGPIGLACMKLGFISQQHINWEWVVHAYDPNP